MITFSCQMSSSSTTPKQTKCIISMNKMNYSQSDGDPPKKGKEFFILFLNY